ncbi:HAMP domain-containing histidine kinase [Acidocella sp. MX-AZ03]|nr:HAMP domain-containing sensor histidine kinase [Acidocella sp. MX-AZ03]WBO59560.1 HAMP domain-containing histidine kinase [Acidocella sp. MX-AZ03]
MIRRIKRARLVRMASFRLAVLGTLLSTLAAMLAFALIYNATASAARHNLAPALTQARAALLAQAASADARTEQNGSADALTENDGSADALQGPVTRAAQAPGTLFYALFAPDGRELAGNLPLRAAAPGWRVLNRWAGDQLPDGMQEIIGLETALAQGGSLFIGADASALAALNRRIAYIFASVFGIALGLGLLISLVIALFSLQRVQAISRTSREIIAGDLSRRVKLYGHDDELDVLTAEVNTMLATVEGLVLNARHVTNAIAHDLRSPLARLRNFLKTAPPDAAALAEATARTEEILKLFAAMLQIAEVEAGAVRGRFTLVDLTALCLGLAETYENVAEDLGQDFRAEIAPGLALRGDAKLLAQMLVNGIENALRHCPPGTAIRFRAQPQGGWIEITISDRGPASRPPCARPPSAPSCGWPRRRRAPGWDSAWCGRWRGCMRARRRCWTMNPA